MSFEKISVDMTAHAEMEIAAVALMKKYGLFLPAPAKEFFRKLADHLNWNDLKEKMK